MTLFFYFLCPFIKWSETNLCRRLSPSIAVYSAELNKYERFAAVMDDVNNLVLLAKADLWPNRSSNRVPRVHLLPLFSGVSGVVTAGLSVYSQFT